jgi:hypothetical protein
MPSWHDAYYLSMETTSCNQVGDHETSGYFFLNINIVFGGTIYKSQRVLISLLMRCSTNMPVTCMNWWFLLISNSSLGHLQNYQPLQTRMCYKFSVTYDTSWLAYKKWYKRFCPQTFTGKFSTISAIDFRSFGSLLSMWDVNIVILIPYLHITY